MVPNAELGQELCLDKDECIRGDPGCYHVEVYRLLDGDADPERWSAALRQTEDVLPARDEPPRLRVLSSLAAVQSDP